MAHSSVIAALYGALGSSISGFVLYPLDVVIVRQQIQRTDPTASSDISIAKTLREIIEREGWSALYKGCSDDIVSVFLQSFLYFYSYERLRNGHVFAIKRQTGVAPRTLGAFYELLYGALAGGFCKVFTTPLKNVVVLEQIDKHDPKPKTYYIRKILALKGVTGFWSGYKATMFLSMNPSLAYYFYQLLSSHYTRKRSVFLNAALAKSLATIITYPVIQAKTRMQANRTDSHLLKNIHETLRRDGLMACFDGVKPQLLKGFFAQGVSFYIRVMLPQLLLLLNYYRHKILMHGLGRRRRITLSAAS